MPEIKRIVNNYAVYCTCDSCPDNVILILGEVIFMTLPPKFEYRCPECDKNFTLDRHYPYYTTESEELVK
jgi:hypothetical protein